jgi:hypothetical protein
MRLNWGVRALRIPVSKGDPWVISAGYSEVNVLRSEAEAPGKKVVLMYSMNCALVLSVNDKNIFFSFV